MGLSGMFAGAVSGFIVKDWGFAWMFLASFGAALPALLFIPALRLQDKSAGTQPH